MTIALGIAGITGRLGILCADAAQADARLSLQGGLARKPDPTRNIVTDPHALVTRCNVLLDVSTADATITLAQACAAQGCALVTGTTGLNAQQADALTEASRHVPVLQAANFSLAVTLLLATARQLAGRLPDFDAEIVESHHRQKRDAPSGTARAIGDAVATGRGQRLEEVMETDRNQIRKPGAIGFASLRMGQIVGEHTLSLTDAFEEITIGHRAFDRRLFARGALQAVRWIQGRQPGLYSMDNVLEQSA